MNTRESRLPGAVSHMEKANGSENEEVSHQVVLDGIAGRRTPGVHSQLAVD